MIKLYRGDVVRVLAPDGKGGLKERHLIVYKDAKADSDFVTVYCTSQNDGNDKENILVLCKSEEGVKMGLTEDTYIRPLNVKTFPRKFFVRRVGRCSLLPDIDRIIDNRMAS